ncbi:MAG: glutaminase A [Tissierella sp.]|nr:glutaminase A [Tissierella sp.]
MQQILEDSIEKNREYYKLGQVATYIPALADADIQAVAVAVTDTRGGSHLAGDYSKKFTLQSISKIISLILAIEDNGEEYTFRKLSKESIDGFFNSINITKDNKLSPMSNAGAISVCSMIKGKSPEEKIDRILNLVRMFSGNTDIGIDYDVYESEKETSNRNKAIAYLLKDTEKMDGNPEEALDVYLKQCSIEVSVGDLANIGAILANNGVNPYTGERILEKGIVRLAKGVMTVSGMYNESGEYFMDVGLPSKSGVSGGILSVASNNFGIGVYSPPLNYIGNSIVGKYILKDIAEKFDLHLFR